MKYSKRYAVLTAILIFAFLIKLNTWNDEYAEVETFRGATLQDEVFYPLKARSVNEEGLLSLTLGETTYGRQDGVILGDYMQVLVSLDFVQDVFGCSARAFQDEVQLCHNDDVYFFPFREEYVMISGDVREIAAPAEMHDGEAYLPLADLCRFFSCDFSFDVSNYQAVMSDDFERGDLPESFDLRKNKCVSKVRDQGSDSTCWAQASLTALESSLLPGEPYSFSVDHMVSNSAMNSEEADGGEYTMALGYLLSWTGPVQNQKVEKHVQEVHFFEKDDATDIKWAVYQHGGVSTSIYANVSASNLNKSSYYSSAKKAYCYSGDNKPNHEVVIIGWDDSFPKENFHGDVPEDGAFICQNSWGDDFGEKGVFYVSYYDSNIGNQAVSYVKIEDVDNYDSIYQSDLCGWIGQVGFNKEKIHGANVFEAEQNEDITSAGFYALGKNTAYQIFVVSDYKGVSSLANRVEVASGTLDDAGYYTIPFEKPCTVEAGQKFAVIVALSTPGSEHPMAIEYQAEDMKKQVDISDGEGYISNNGLDWDSVEETTKGNLCIKAYGKLHQATK